MSLRASIQALVEHGRDTQARADGVPDADIRESARTGMDARDVQFLRALSRKQWLFVVRCPKRTARAWHGVLPPKTMAVKQKTGTSGVAVLDDHRMFVSDYDLMSVWRRGGQGWTKVFMSAANGAPRGKWMHEAHEVVLEMNRGLVSRIQHGCQDDFHSAKNPGVDPSKDHFAAFADGIVTYLPDLASCAKYYAREGLTWPYDAAGKYVGPKG